MAEDLQAVDIPPAHKAVGSPFNGVVPPVEHRWKPGQSGNPTGGWADPPGPRLRRALTKLLDSKPEMADAIVRRIAEEALNGEPGDALKAAALLWDRDEGKAKQAIEHSGSVTQVNLNVEGQDSP